MGVEPKLHVEGFVKKIEKMYSIEKYGAVKNNKTHLFKQKLFN